MKSVSLISNEISITFSIILISWCGPLYAIIEYIYVHILVIYYTKLISSKFWYLTFYKLIYGRVFIYLFHVML